MSHRLIAKGALALGLALVFAAPAAAGPVARNDEEYEALGRVFPEIAQSTSYTRFAADFVPAIQYLESRYPDRLKLWVYGKSVENRDLYAIELTNELSPIPYEEREKVVIDISMHASERAPTEGAVRYLEDMAESDDPADVDLLNRTVLLLSFPNPDGWARMNAAGTNSGTRANANGVDLNRTFPSIGYLRSEWRALTEPESIATKALLDQPEYAAARWGHSIHCYTVNSRSYVQLLWMAGENDLRENEVTLRFVRKLNDRITEATDGLAFGTNPTFVPVMHGTVWETRRSINTGFLGGYMAHPEPAGQHKYGIAFEHWNCENANFNRATQTYQVEAIRASLRVATEATLEPEPKVKVKLPGVSGFLVDDAVVTDADEDGVVYVPVNDFERSFEQFRYEATRMRFFTDLKEYTPGLVPVPVGAANAPGRLGQLDSLVISESTLGVGTQRLRNFVQGGGTLILTDGAVRALTDLVGVPESAILRRVTDVARLNANTRDWLNPLLAGLNRPDQYSEQLFEPVPNGFQLSPGRTPWWSVSTAAFTAAGGTVVAQGQNANTVYLGELPLGKGRIVVVGGLLPQPTEEFFHPYGLASYSVTYTGYQVLLNALGAELEVTG